MGEPFVSVVIPTHNRAAWLQQVLVSLESQTYGLEHYEVIVVDNSSTDGTAALLETFTPSYPLRRLYVPKRDSFEAAAVRNAGARASQADILLFVDSDILADRRLIENHVAFHRAAPDLCVVGSVLYLPEAKMDPQALCDGTWKSRITVATPDPLETPLFCFSENLTSYRVPWFVCHSGNFSVARAHFEAAGLFDEWHKTWSIEDLDLGYRLYRRGLRFAFSRRATGYHLHHDTVPRVDKLESVRRGLTYLQEKHPGDPGVNLWGEIWRYESQLLSLDHAMTTWQFDAWKGRRLHDGDAPASPIPDLSLVVYVHNRRAMLESMLHSLVGQTWPADRFEVIVVNGTVAPSSDDTEIMIQTISVPYRLRYFAMDWQNQANDIKVKRLGIKLALKQEAAPETRQVLERHDRLLERREKELKRSLVDLAQRVAEADLIKFLDLRSQVHSKLVENVMASLPLDAAFTRVPDQNAVRSEL